MIIIDWKVLKSKTHEIYIDYLFGKLLNHTYRQKYVYV